MTTKIISEGKTSIKRKFHIPVSFMLAPLHGSIDKGEYESIFLDTIWKYGKFTYNSKSDRLVTVKRQKGNCTLFSGLSNNLLKKTNKRIAC